MKPLTLFIVSLLLFHCLSYGQQTCDAQEGNHWYFHPFSVDFQVGTWIPVGNLRDHLEPALQLGAGFAFGANNTRVRFMIMPRFFSRNTILVVQLKDTSLAGKLVVGGNVGGSVEYTVFRSQTICTELAAGLTWEFIDTDISWPDNKELELGGVGISLGTNIWINAFKSSNIGLRTIYTYTAYDNPDFEINTIAGSSLSISIICRMPKRSNSYSNWYRKI